MPPPSVLMVATLTDQSRRILGAARVRVIVTFLTLRGLLSLFYIFEQLSTIDIILSTKEDFLSKKIEKIYNIGEDISIEITGANPKVKSQDAPRPLGTHKHNSIYIVCLFDITVITA